VAAGQAFTICLPFRCILARAAGEATKFASWPGSGSKGEPMIWLALAMFISLFGWGAQYFGWHDPVGKVQLALFTSFILGMICGYKSQG
jgi:hypothetical protein